MRIIKSVIIFISIMAFSLSAQEELDNMPKIKGGIQALTQNIKYPKASKEHGITGTVFVKAVINAKGKVIKTEIDKGVDKDLDLAAVKAVERTKFIPGVKDGKNVKSEVIIPIKFRLDDKKKK